MAHILQRFFLPHPPAAVDVIHGSQEEQLKKTIEAIRHTAKEIAIKKPKTIIIITPHGPCFGDHYYIPSQKRISGDFSAYGNKKFTLGFNTDLNLANIIHKKAMEKGLSAGFVDDRIMKSNCISYDLDHGILVPMYFICQYYQDFKLLPISLSGQNGKFHYKMGIALRDAINEYSAENVIIIASGDLSHKATEEQGAAFDKKIKKLLLSEDIPNILNFDPEQKEQAEQCGLDSCRMLLGTLDGFDFYTEILAYEHPLGTGYLSAELHCGKPKESAFVHYLAKEETRLLQQWETESPAVQLSRKAITAYLQDNTEIPPNAETPTSLKDKSCGLYVTLKNDGRIRGNAGTITATHPTLEEEIIYHSIRAVDNIIEPITKDELKDISIEVCLLSEPEEIQNLNQLDPQTYGLIVESKKGRAVLLPGLPYINTPEEQINAAKKQIGIHPWRKVKYKRFSVTRYR